MKKFLSYVLTFFIMFFMSAGVTVWFSQSRGNNGIVNPEQNVGGASGSSFFTQLLETFNTEKQFKIKGDLNIDYNDMEIPLFVDVNIDINDTNNIKLEGVIIIDIDGNDFTFDFVYHSNVVYLSYNDIYVKLAVSDINSILGTIKELIPSNQNSNSQNNVQTPEQKPTQSIDFNKLLDQYMPTIMAALNNIEETELENGDKKYTLKIEKLAEAGLICNSEDVLKSVELETANFDGLQVGANLSIKFDKELEVVDPSQDVYFSKYIDVSNALNIVKNTLNKRDLNLFAGVKINENSVSANLGYDFNTKNFKATLINNSYGYVDNAKVVFVDGDLYLTVNNAKILINEQMIKDCSPLIKDLLKQINIEESLGVSQKTTELISRVKELFDNNVASILAIVQNIELTNSCISLKFDSSILGLDVGILNIAVNIDEDSINSLSISGVEIDGQSIEINAELKEEQIDYSVQDAESYLNVYEFYNQNKYLFDAKEFDVSLALDILMDGQEKNINIDALISKDYINVDCELIGNLYNKLGLICKDGFLYVGVNDAKVKLESDKVFEALKNLGVEGKIQESINSLSGQIADKVQSLTIEDILSLLVVAKDINVSSSGVRLNVSSDIVGLSGNIDLVVNFEQGKIKSISVYGVEVDNNKFDVDVVLNKTSIEPLEINEEDYLNVSWTLEKINSILSATNGTITLKADIGYGEQIFNIDLSLCGSVEEKFAKIVLALNGTYDLDLNANYYEDKLYANMGDAFISVDLEYILGVLGLVQEKVDIESIKNELTSTEIDVEKIYLVKNLMTFIKGIKYEDLRKINLVANSNGVVLTLDKSILNTEADFVLSISFVSENVTNVSFTKVNITEELNVALNLTIDTTPVEQSAVEVEEEKYLDVKETISRVEEILSNTNGTITLKADVGYGEQVFNIDLSLCGSVEEKFAKIVLALNGTYDLDLNANYYEDKLYANMGDAFISVDLEYILGVIGLVKENVDLESLKKELTSTEIDVEKIYLVKNLMTFIKGIKYEDFRKISLVTNSNGVVLTLDKSILNTEADFVLSISFVSENVTNISFTKVNITEEIYASVNLTVDVTPVTQEQVEVDETKYLDVATTVERIENILATTNGTITLKADIGYGEQIFNIDLSLCGSIEDKFAKIVLALNGTYDLDLNANYYEDKLYANIGDAFISVDLEYILGILGLVQEKVDIESIKNEIISTEIDVEKIYLVKNLMTFIKGIKYEDLRKISLVANSNGVVLTLDKSILNTDSDFVLSILFVSENVTNISFTKVNITEDIYASVNLTVDTTPVEQSAVEVEEEKYLDVKETISRVEEILSTTNGIITLKADIGYGEKVFNIDLRLCGSIEEKFAKIVLALNGTYDLDLNANYYNDKLFANMGEAFVSVDLEYILGVLGLVQETVDVESLKNELTSTEIDIEKIYIVKNLLNFVQNIKYEDLKKVKIVANNNGLTLTLDKSILNTDSDFVLSISFVSENVTNVSFTKVDVTEELNVALNLTIDTTPVEQTAVEVEEEKYLDVATTVERIENILATTNGTITLKADIGYGEQVFNIDLSLCGSIEEKFAKIVLALNGTYDLDLNANYYNDKLFANMGDAFISVDLEYILGVLGLVQENVDIESIKNELTSTEIDVEKIYIVKNLMTFIKGIKYEDLKKVNIVANNSGLTLTLDKSILNTDSNFVLSISFVSENITNITFTKVDITEDIYASVNLTLDVTPVTQEQVEVDETKYLDVATTIERIENILATTNGTITLKADIGYGEQVFNIDLNLCGSIEEKFAKIVLALNGTYDLDLNANYYNDKLFANMGEAFVSVDLEYILGVLGLVQEKVDVEGIVEEDKKTNIDLTEIYIVKNLLNFVQNIKYEDLKKVNIVANNNGLTLTLDKSILNTETDFVLSISFVSENVTNISFTKVNITEDIYASVNLTLDVTPVTQEEVEVEATKYLDVKETISRVEEILSTTNGTITLKADIGYGEQIFNIDISLCGSIEEKFAKIVLALNGTYDLDLNANYYNDKLFANISDIFVSIDKQTIEDIIEEFTKKDNEDNGGEQNKPSSGNSSSNKEDILIVKNILNFIKNFEINDLYKFDLVANNKGLTLTLDKSILNTEADFVLSISFVSESETNVSFTKVNITEDIYASVNLTLDVTPVTQEEVEVDETKYLDVKETISRVEEILSTTNGTITLKADIGYGEQIFNIDLSLCGSIEEKFAKIVLALNGTYDLHLNANYYNDKLFANMGDAFVSVDLEYILGVLGLVQDKVDVEGLVEEVKNTNVDLTEIYIVKNLLNFVQNIKYEDLRKINVVANASGLTLTLDKSILNTDSDFVLSISFVSENVTNISFTKVNITEDIYASVNLTIDITPVEQTDVEVEEEKYLDVATTIERVENILETTNGTITLKADIGYGEQVFNIDLSLCGSVEEKFAKIVLALNGTYELDLNASYYNEKAFIDLEEIMLSVGLADLKELLAEFKIDLDKTINDTKEDISTSIENNKIETSDLENILIIKNLLNFVQNIKYEDLKKVNIVANNNGLTLTLDKSILNTEADFVLSISFVSENITNVSFTKVNITEDIYASANLTVDITPVEQTAVMTEEEKYLDLRALMDNLEEIIDGNNIWIDLEASLFTKENQEYLKEMGVDLEFGKQLVGVDLKLYALVEYMYKEYGVGAKINYSDSTLFASALGLNVKVDNGRIIDSVHTILAMFVENEKEYDDILGMIVDILSGNSIIEEIKQFTKGRENTSEESESGSTIKVDYEYLLSELTNKIAINSNMIDVSFNLECLGLEGVVEAVITLSQGKIVKIEITKLKIKDRYLDANLALDYTAREEFPVISEEEKTQYIDIAETANLLESTVETLTKKTISGQITVKFDKEGEVDATIDYGIKIVEGKVEAYLTTTFKGVPIDIRYKYDTFYLDIVGLKVYLEFSSINDLIAWINEEFDTNITFKTDILGDIKEEFKNLDKTLKSFDIENVMKNLSSVDLSFINYVKYTQNMAEVLLDNNYKLNISYGESVDSVQLVIKEKLLVSLTCCEYNDFTNQNIYPVDNELNVYKPYTDLIDLYDSVMETINQKQFDITANAKAYQEGKETYNVDIFDFAFDITDGLNAYGSALVTGEEDVEFDAAFKDEKLYVNYDGLKVAMSWGAIKELLVIVLELVGVDPTTIGFLKDVADEMQVNADNLGNYLPGMDFDNPLNSIKHIKNISFNDGMFSITIDGKLMNPEATTYMDIVIGTSDKGITSASINNFFTGTSDERFDLMVNLNEFNGVKELTDAGTYNDLSNATDLIKAFINTSSLHDYHISGKLKLGIIGIDGLASINVDAQIKSDEEGNVIAAVELNNYPLVGVVNGGNTNGLLGGALATFRKRSISLYFENDTVYLKTVDEKTTFAKQYNRVTKVKGAALIDNIGYYIQWLLGFKDSIQKEIDQLIYDCTHFTGETDMGNILKEYNLESDGRHKLVINLGEIAHTADIGDATLHIATTKVTEQKEQTKEDGTTEIVNVEKDYVYSLDMGVEMLDGTITIDTDSNNKLYLVDIGLPVDVSSAENHINQYPYNLDAEYKKEGTMDASDLFDGFTQTNANTVYVSFDTDGGNALSDISGTIGANMTLPTPTKVINGVTYQFIGWYYEDGTKCELTSYPRSNLTLYARWFKYTLSFETNGGFDIASREEYEGTVIELPNPTKYVDRGDMRTYYTFEGWFLNPEFEGEPVSSVTLKDNTTVYAKWKEERKAETRTLYVYSNGRLLLKERYEIGASITLPEGIVGSTRIVDKKNVDYSVYTCTGWDKEVSVMGNKEITVTAIWELTTYKKYYKINFVVEWYDAGNNGVSYDDLNTKPDTSAIEEEYWVLGDGDFEIPDFGITAQDKHGFLNLSTRNYKVVGWKTTPASYGSAAEYTTSITNVSSNMTLYAVWQKV